MALLMTMQLMQWYSLKDGAIAMFLRSRNVQQQSQPRLLIAIYSEQQTKGTTKGQACSQAPLQYYTKDDIWVHQRFMLHSLEVSKLCSALAPSPISTTAASKASNTASQLNKIQNLCQNWKGRNWQ